MTFNGHAGDWLNGLFLLNASGVIVENNFVANNIGGGIMYSQGTGTAVIIRSNILANNTDNIGVNDCSNIIIDNNTVNGGSDQTGISAQNSSNLSISRNTVSGNSESINLMQVHDANVTQNKIAGVNNGIRLFECLRANVADNELTGNKCGISLQNTNYTKITGNNVAGSAAFSIGFGVSTNNQIFNNTFAGRAGSGFTEAVVDSASINNVWDDGSKGNFWGDYKGYDQNSDTIGDSPYVINAANVDRYPLANTANVWPPQPSPFPTYSPSASPELNSPFAPLPPEVVVMTTVTVGGVVGAVAAVSVAVQIVGQASASTVSSLPLPQPLKDFLKKFGEKSLDKKLNRKKINPKQTAFITKTELGVLAATIAITTAVVGFVKAGGIPSLATPAIFGFLFAAFVSTCIIQTTV